MNHAARWCQHGQDFHIEKQKIFKEPQRRKNPLKQLGGHFEVAIKPRWVLNDKYNPQTKRAKPG